MPTPKRPGRRAQPKASAEGRAFGVMLHVKKALLTGAVIHGPGQLTILEASEDAASTEIEQAIMAAEQRGERRAVRRAQAGRARR